ncbi:SNF2 family N-terminal domain-containing protein [Xylaria grammica]|nr:SNF2 family N-terminal domain-containing protein [Xylaria grammica]
MDPRNRVALHGEVVNNVAYTFGHILNSSPGDDQVSSQRGVGNDVAYKFEHILNSSPGDETVCFGSFSGITGECEFTPGLSPSSRDPSLQSISATLDSCSEFTMTDGGYSRGTISTQHRQLLQAILDELTAQLQVSCTFDGTDGEKPKRVRSASRIIPCSLNIIIYGPLSLSEELGDFFQSYDIYLQDPRHCDRQVKYCNPHRLSSTDPTSLPMTSEINSIMNTIELDAPELIPERSELLAILNTIEELPEAQQPEAIRTTLERHQKQALTFMSHREQGWDFESNRDIWARTRGLHGHFFVNLVSGSHRSKEPPQFLGGIIADPMGLGKTLTVIALVATDLQGADFVDEEVSQDEANNTTLIVVPPPLIDTWEEQLSQHVQQGQLTWRRHHGKTRLMDSLEIQNLNIVLTTYHTVSAEWKSGSKSGQSILFSTHWRRVVLDEAHFVRNTASRMTKAICDLASDIRWAVTGTPIQNRLSDLAALLKFLRVYPYDDMRRFDADISHLWKSRQADEAVNRLKTLSRCLILRRPKATINLPPRTDLRRSVDFTFDERALYNDIKTQTIATMRQAAYGEANRASPRFVNVIQQINLMRLICNLGLHYSSRHEHITTYEGGSPNTTDWERIAQQTLNFQCETATLTCELCGLSTNMTETLLEDSGVTSKPLFSQCLRFFCPDCTQSPKRGARNFSCGHYPPHPIATVSLSRSAFEEDDIQTIPHASMLLGAGLPSKVTALVRELSCQSADVKSVVFSTWRMTLDVVEQGLKQAHIDHLRFDGKVPQKERKGIIDKFRKDPTVKVLLLTLTCGAVGLTLTEATRAYLMEPHWNPTMEEQALARVHRLGQTKEVTTVRFYVRDTFEERVMELQKKKEDLAGLLLDSQTGNTEHLERLCGLL